MDKNSEKNLPTLSSFTVQLGASLRHLYNNNHETLTSWKRESGHRNPVSHIPAIKGKTVYNFWRGTQIRERRWCERAKVRSVRAHLFSGAGSLVVDYRARNVATRRSRLAGELYLRLIYADCIRIARRRGWCILCKRDCSARPFASCLTFPP